MQNQSELVILALEKNKEEVKKWKIDKISEILQRIENLEYRIKDMEKTIVDIEKVESIPEENGVLKIRTYQF